MTRRLPALLLALCVAFPAAAPAQDDGVVVDPDSPSGREYQLPLESARRTADPRRKPGAKVAPGEQSSPLFGEGIEPEQAPLREEIEPTDDDNGESAAGGSGPGGSGGNTTPPPAGEPLREAVSRPGTPDGGSGTTLLIIGGAAVVLLAGVLGGLALRRSGAQTSTPA